LPSNSAAENISAPEIEVRKARRTGMRASSAAAACAVAGPSISRQGSTMRCSAMPAHSTIVTATLPLVPCFRAFMNSGDVIACT
jgi:hypothetical protein